MNSISDGDRFLERACDQFEGAWKKGTPPELLGFLRERGWSPDGDDQTLATELVCIDLEFRWRQASALQRRAHESALGVRPAAEDYARTLYGDAAGAPADEWVEIEYRARRQANDDQGADALREAARGRLGAAMDRIDRELHRVRSEAATLDPSTIAPGRWAKEAELPSPGEEFGRYRLVRKLGEGGMGAVYEAEELDSGRLVALKLLKHTIASPEARSRFFREGRLAASINHPNSVYVFGTEEIDGTPAISMERIAGGTLDDRVRAEGPYPVSEAVDAILQVIEGLEAAEQKGVLHRDVKPSNCFIDADGVVKVGDFGLSISTSARGDSHLTTAGSFLGTPAFSSPEQLRGEELDVRSDIYAVGVTLYQLLTGETPHHAENLVKLLATVLEQSPKSPRELRPEVPRELASVVLKCLAKQPASRFKSYAELRGALTPFGSAAPTPATLGWRALAGLVDGTLMYLFALVLQQGETMARAFAETANPNVSAPLDAYAWWVSVSALNVMYYAVPEGIYGRSLGKSLFGLRVVRRDKSPPGVARAAARALLYIYLPCLVTLPLFVYFATRAGLTGDWLMSTEDYGWLSLANLSFYFLLCMLFVTARRTNGYAGVHDLLTGVRVIGKGVQARRVSAVTEARAANEAHTGRVLGPYDVLDQLAESKGVCTWLAYDKRLLRRVWIRQLPKDAPPLPPHARDLARPGRLRWITAWSDERHTYHAYEGLSGDSLTNLIATRRPWSEVRFWLLDLAQELVLAEKDGSTPDVLSLDRVWITADGRAKLLDFPTPAASVQEVRSAKTPQELLSMVAAGSLYGEADTTTETNGQLIPPLPLEVNRLLSGIEQQAVHTSVERLEVLSARQTVVTRRRRFAIFASIAAFPVLSAVVIGSGVFMPRTMESDELKVIELEQYVKAMGDLEKLDEQAREHWEVYLADRFGELLRRREILSGPLARDSAKRALIQAIVARGPPSAVELSEATAAVAAIVAKTRDPAGLQGEAGAWFALFAAWLAYAFLPHLTAALFARRGAAARIAHVDYVTPDGSVAGRHRLITKAIALHAPMIIFPLVSFVLYAEPGVPPEESGPVVIQHAAVMMLPIVLVLTLWSSLLRTRGLTDYLCGTYPVPN